MAAAIGPFLGMFLIENANFSINLVICAVVIIISFIGALLLKVPKVEIANGVTEIKNTIQLSSFFESKAIPISVVTAFIGFSYSSVLSFLTSYSKELDLVDTGSFFFIAYAAAILISRPIVGRLFDKKGENVVIYSTILLFAFGLLILVNVHHGFALLTAGVLVGLGYGNFLSSAQAISVKVSPNDRMGLATSTFFMFTDGGVGIGPFLLGFFIPLIGFRGLYLTAAVVTLACVILYYFLHGRKATMPNRSYK
jgi:MFS family permease